MSVGMFLPFNWINLGVFLAGAWFFLGKKAPA
jgi:hypothetical protein